MTAGPSSPEPATGLRAAAVVLAGGSGTRVGAGVNKVYLPLAGRRVISWSFRWAARLEEVTRFLIVVRPEDADDARRILAEDAPGLDVDVVHGGATRHESEEAALEHLRPVVEAGSLDVVAIHDGARPLAGPSLWRSVVRTAAAAGGAVPTVPATGLLPVTPAGEPLPPDGRTAGLVRVQTPQAFRAAELLAAYDAARVAGYRGTDTAVCVETFAHLVVRSVPSTPTNLKVTYPHDLLLAERLLAAAGRRLV